jgi:sodium/potassium-transporting ATPase subunit alpha
LINNNFFFFFSFFLFFGKWKERLVGKKDPTIAIKNLIFVGLITLRDPPRDEVPQAIRECYEASIKVVMVTGDHPLTAEAIARNIGLITQPTQRSLAAARRVPMHEIDKNDPAIGAMVVRGVEITGSALEHVPPMTADDWRLLLSMKEIVFARTSPENKLTIIQEFTKAGHVTAMTGDGVNDSPALKQAAIGMY